MRSLLVTASMLAPFKSAGVNDVAFYRVEHAVNIFNYHF
jgi:hypothetical protein